MAVTYKDRHEMLPLPHMGIMLQHTFQQEQPPLLPSVYNMEVVEVTADRSSAEIQAWLNLNAWRPCTTISKEVGTNFQQEGSSLWFQETMC